MPFQVIFRPRAELDIAAAMTWRARSDPAAGIRWRAGLLRVVENLELRPASYPVADEAADLGIDLRYLLYGRRRDVYRILFTIDGQTVSVHRVRHAAQDRLAADDV